MIKEKRLRWTCLIALTLLISAIFLVMQVSAAAVLYGTVTDADMREANIVAGTKTIIIQLNGGENWIAADGGANQFNDEHALLLIKNITAGDQVDEWTKVQDALIAATSGGLNTAIERSAATSVKVTLPATAGYNIATTQTITVTVPAGLNNAGDLVAAPTFTIDPDATAAITGTVTTADPREADIVAGGNTIIVTLTGAEWIAADSGSQFSDAHALLLIENITAGDQVAEWQKVNTSLVAATAGGFNTAIVRTSATVVTITLPTTAGYDIATTQTITVNVPADLTNTVAITATPTFTVEPDATAAITGTVTDAGLREANIVAGGKTIIITLTGANWIAADSGSQFSDAHALLLIENITAGDQVAEWQKVNTSLVAATAGGFNTAIVRTSATVVTITLPATAGYDIATTQTITVNVPADLTNTVAITATPTFTINPDGTTPVPTSVPSSSGGGSGSSSMGASVSGSVTAGGTASFTFTKTSVFEVTTTVKEDTPKIMVTVKKATLPRGLDAPEQQVYQYQEVTVYWADDSDISKGTLEFAVTKSWLSQNGLTFGDIVMIRYNEDTKTWDELPTEFISEDANNYIYRATTPGFSLFGIAASDGATIVSEDKSIKTVDVVGEEEVIVTISKEETPVATEATPKATPIGFAPLAALLIFGIILFMRRK